MIKLNAQQLRTTPGTSPEAARIKRNPIYIVLDNVLDTYNIGGIFRLADAVAAAEVIICGESLTPPHTRIKKASINTTEWVPWQYTSTAIEAIAKLKTQNPKLKTVAIEQDGKSRPYNQIRYTFPLALVVGNETYGVSKKVFDLADEIAEIPLWGVNKSLNVMVSLGIVLFAALTARPGFATIQGG